jgi:excisionase family DNA binding protein
MDRWRGEEKETDMGKLLKIPEVAEFLNISCKTAWAMVYRRDIEVVRIGRSVRIPQRTLDQLVERGTIPAAKR